MTTMIDMEKDFSKFLDSQTYDNAEQFLFDALRSAYRAGWNAAMTSCMPADSAKNTSPDSF